MLNIIIPMAGRGTRLSMYDMPKILVNIYGKSMIQVCIENIKPKTEHRFIFIVRKDHYEKYNLKELLTLLAPNCIIVQTDKITEGQASSILLAKKYIDNDDELIQSNSDHFVDTNFNDFIKFVRKEDIDGCILTCLNNDPKYSYVKINEDGFVVETAEKKVIAPNCFVIPYFRKGKDFVRAIEKMIEKNIRVNNEFYVNPCINELISEGKKFKIYDIGEGNLYCLGDEEGLNKFLKSEVAKNLK